MNTPAPVQVIPYLSFQGNCEEAIRAYIAAFGGEVLYLSRWSVETAKKGPQQVGKVMHAEFCLGATRMAAGDIFDDPAENGAVKLMIHMEDMARAKQAIALLQEGGQAISPLQPHPAPDDGGCGSETRDRFGYTWIITCPNPDKVPSSKDR
ncbi:MAG: VOC family protein [Clostridia bacterium]|nr:VOC family protein [Clostridia bacterium]